MDASNSPKLFVSKRCENFIACMKEYTGTMGKDEPSKVKIDACLALQRGTGIMVDSVPVNDADRQKTIAEDREVASMSPQQLLERVTGRLQAMRSASATGEGKAS